jgi:uncharacterized lipoprotein YehR (DUF1307 family)
MSQLNKLLTLVAASLLLISISGCSPEVGSEKWCAMMKEKPKGDWTANEATDFTKHCIFPVDDK